jgi:hypothetical protein
VEQAEQCSALCLSYEDYSAFLVVNKTSCLCRKSTPSVKSYLTDAPHCQESDLVYSLKEALRPSHLIRLERSDQLSVTTRERQTLILDQAGQRNVLVPDGFAGFQARLASTLKQHFFLARCSFTDVNACMGQVSAWKDTDEIKSGDIVAWVDQKYGKVAACEATQIEQKDFPPNSLSGLLQIFKASGNGTAANGTSINLDDEVYLYSLQSRANVVCDQTTCGVDAQAINDIDNGKFILRKAQDDRILSPNAITKLFKGGKVATFNGMRYDTEIHSNWFLSKCGSGLIKCPIDYTIMNEGLSAFDTLDTIRSGDIVAWVNQGLGLGHAMNCVYEEIPCISLGYPPEPGYQGAFFKIVKVVNNIPEPKGSVIRFGDEVYFYTLQFLDWDESRLVDCQENDCQATFYSNIPRAKFYLLEAPRANCASYRCPSGFSTNVRNGPSTLMTQDNCCRPDVIAETALATLQDPFIRPWVLLMCLCIYSCCCILCIGIFALRRWKKRKEPNALPIVIEESAKSIYAVGIDKTVYVQSLEEMTPSSAWTQASAGYVVSIAVHADRIYGIGAADSKVYTQETSSMTTDSSWTLATAGDVTSIAVHIDKIYGVGIDNRVYAQRIDEMSESTSWTMASAGDVINIAIYRDTIYGVGIDNKVYRQELSEMTPFSSWKLASVGDVVGITINAGTIYGVAIDEKAGKPIGDFIQSNLVGTQAFSVIGIPACGYAWHGGEWIFSWEDDSKRKLVLTDSQGVKLTEGYVSLNSTDWHNPSTWLAFFDTSIFFGVKKFHYNDQANKPTADVAQSDMEGIQASAVSGVPAHGYASNGHWIFSWIDDDKRKLVLADSRGTKIGEGYVTLDSTDWEDPSTWMGAHDAIMSFGVENFHYEDEAVTSVAPNAVITRSNAAGVQVFSAVGATAALGDGFEGHWIFSWVEKGKRRLVLTDWDGAKVAEGYVPSSSRDWEDPSTWIVEEERATPNTSYSVDNFHYPNQAEPIADFSQSNIEGIQATCLGVPAIGSGYNGQWIFHWMDDENDIRKLVLTDSHGAKVKEGYVTASNETWEDPSTWLMVDYGCASLRLENFRYPGQVWKQSLDEMTTTSAWILAGAGDMIDVAIKDMDLPAVADDGKAGKGKNTNNEIMIHVRPDEKERAPQYLEDAPQAPPKEGQLGHFSIPLTPKTPNLAPKTPMSPSNDHSIVAIPEDEDDFAVCDEFGVDAIVDHCNLDELTGSHSGEANTAGHSLLDEDQEMGVGDEYYNDQMVLADEYCNAEDIEHYNLDALDNVDLGAKEITDISHRDLDALVADTFGVQEYDLDNLPALPEIESGVEYDLDNLPDLPELQHAAGSIENGTNDLDALVEDMSLSRERSEQERVARSRSPHKYLKGSNVVPAPQEADDSNTPRLVDDSHTPHATPHQPVAAPQTPHTPQMSIAAPQTPHTPSATVAAPRTPRTPSSQHEYLPPLVEDPTYGDGNSEGESYLSDNCPLPAPDCDDRMH